MTRRRTGRPGGRRRDGGQMLLLSGVILVLAVLTLGSAALTFSAQLGNIPAAADSGVAQRYITLRTASQSFFMAYDEKEVPVLVGEDLTRHVLAQLNLSLSRGESLVVRLATTGDPVQESDLVTGGVYATNSWEGSETYTHAYDGTNDGVIWQGNDVRAVLIFLEFRGQDFKVQETLVLPV